MSRSNELEVVGTKKDMDDLRFEEQWMKRIELLESQYDQYVTKIQKRLLDGKFNKRIVTSFRDQNTRLKSHVQDLTNQSEGLQSKLQILQTDLQKKEKQENKLKSQLTSIREETKEQKSKVKKSDETVKKATHERELAERQAMIRQNQQKKLDILLKERDVEISQIRREVQTVSKESHVLVQELTKVEEQKRRMSRDKEAAAASVAFLLRERETDEERMIRLKHELTDIIKALQNEKQKFNEKEHQHYLREKNLQSMRDELKKLLSKVTSATLETQYWKQEAEMLLKVAEAPPPTSLTSVTKEQARQRQLHRCKEADIIHRLTILEKRLKEMEQEKFSLTNQMKSLTSLHKSLIRVHQKNLNQRKTFEETSGWRYPCQRNEKKVRLSASKTRIEEQEKKLEALDKELFKSKRAYNFLQFKLQGKSELEKNLRQVEKTLLRVEREKRDNDDVARRSLRKLGEGSAFDWSSLQGGVLSQINKIQDLREKLPPLVQRGSSKFDSVQINSEDLDGKLSKLRKELTILERKQTVYQNIQGAKERLTEEQRIREMEKVEDESEEFIDTEESSSETAEDNSLTANAPSDEGDEAKKEEEITSATLNA